MFAIAGVTFAYTSCTDYSEDINKVDGRVDNLQSQFDAFKSATDESIKVSPDIPTEELDEILKYCMQSGIDGIV